jgi:hypothetical protein
MERKLSMVLMDDVLELIRASGANMCEAKCALSGASAFLLEIGLEHAPTVVIET